MKLTLVQADGAIIHAKMRFYDLRAQLSQIRYLARVFARQSWHRAPGTLRRFYEYDMRWSYYLIAGLIVLGAVASFFLPNGWTVWPFLFVAGAMSMVHEAADRNGQGIPPLHVYALVGGAMFLYVGIILIFSFFNPLVLLLGVFATAYQVAKGYLQDRERSRIIASRRAGGCCIHCGQPADPKLAFCGNCGEEPDPAGARLRRVSSIINTRKNVPRSRSILTKEAPSVGASRKERALLARSQWRQKSSRGRK
jgi:hypothetical protein